MFPCEADAPMRLDELEAELLNLDVEHRAKLVMKLLSSLDSLSDRDNERLWIEEAERRNQELDAGQTAGRVQQIPL